MSSDSDDDLFFDAHDVTPVVTGIVVEQPSKVRPDVHDTSNKNLTKQCLTYEDLEEEKRHLLEKQKLAEERRIKEQQEIQRELAQLEEKKVEEAERKKIEERRKKLEAIRQTVDSSQTQQQFHAHQSRISPVTSGVDVPVPRPSAPKAAHGQDLEAVGDASDPPRRSSLPGGSDSGKERREFFRECFMNTNDTIDRNRPANIEVDKAPGKNIPEVDVNVDDDLTDDRCVVSQTRTPPSESDFTTEPDIVQSTKANSLNRSVQMAPPGGPVAPPRKKKGPTVRPLSDSLPNLDRPNVPYILTRNANTLTRVMSLTQEPESSAKLPGAPDGSEPTLDINSATKGDRVVTVVEDSLAKGAAGNEEDPGSDIDRPIASRDSDKPDGAESSLMRLTLGIARSGDGEEYSIPLSMSRPRSGSGSRFLTDKEILDHVYVVNLDTGETVPLSLAEEKLPKCINPLSLHIMRRTKEYSSDSKLYKGDQSDDEGNKDSNRPRTVKTVKPLRKRKLKLKKFLRTKIKTTIKSVKGTRGDESSDDDDETGDGRSMIKVKASHSNKGPYEFDMLVPIQDLAGQCSGAVWTMKFSHCGRLLATGGQDKLLRVWVLKDAFSYFNEMRQKYNEASGKSSQDSLDAQNEGEPGKAEGPDAGGDDDDAEYLPFMKRPFCIYRGHTADLLDVSWSKNYFILSSSMDKTVRLWHISRRECLCCFQHIDFVTAIAFHPKDDRYFLSGSLDGKLRLWNIPDKKVALWNEVSNGTKLITAANFCLNGRFAVVGTYDGRCVFYTTEQLKYFTQIHVRSTRGKNARGRKITGVEPFPGEDKILVTSNDSRIRLYDLRDLTLGCKYKGCLNNSSQIKASFSHDGKFIICGSEDHCVYIWKTQHDFYKFHSARRDRNDFWEGIKANSAVVTNAIFAPNPTIIIKPQFQYLDADDKDNTEAGQGEVLVSADYTGVIKVFINKFKPGC